MKKFFDTLRQAFESPEVADDTPAIELACAVLLAEISRADGAVDAGEVDRMEKALVRLFGLPMSDARAMVQEGISHADDVVSLHDYTRLINDTFDADEKRALMRKLWQVAFADDELHHFEEHQLRRLADLLYIPHRVFIQTKLEVAG